uniref:DEAD/SNF2-like helicase n=1 Tax=Pithovirus LCPAC201 TaxID=2506591 RepID=A0A481Z4U4_9VIRU|nr:MAG: DEAD/SNF2-like helicase [Pithovirus LCPAC201]
MIKIPLKQNSKNPEMVTLKSIITSSEANSQNLKPLILKPYQETHLHRMIQILRNCPVVLDTSTTGSGKTYTTTALAALYKLPMIIITAPTCFKVWKDIQKDHRVQIIDMISYDILRGQTGKACNHRYLIRTEDDRFVPTEHLKNILRSGVLIVFDEMSKLKNQESGVKAASHAIVKALLDVKSGSRIVLLSALPCDKTIHILSLMQMLGVIYNDKIYKYNGTSRKYDLKGLQEAIDWCSLKDQATTDDILSQYVEINKKCIPHLAKNLYRNVIKSRLSSCMKAKIDPDRQMSVKNGYYQITGEDMELLKFGQRTLRNAVRYYGDQAVNRKLTNWGEVTKALQILGIAKLHTLVSLAYRDLTSNPQRKIVICAWYVDQLRWLTKVFEPFGSGLLYGPTDAKDREGIVNLFQEPNSKCRVIVLNPTVGGMAISLDDRDGKWPRTMLIVPDYRFIELVQCTGRVYRQSTKSKEDTIIRFIYAEQFRGESKILNALLQKSSDARSVISDDSGLILPDNYQTEDGLGELESIDCPPLPIKEKFRLELLQIRRRQNLSNDPSYQIVENISPNSFEPKILDPQTGISDFQPQPIFWEIHCPLTGYFPRMDALPSVRGGSTMVDFPLSLRLSPTLLNVS